jgi:hypothetical protein
MKITWSAKSISSLQQLILFIDNKWDKKVAKNLLDETDMMVVRISENPFMFPVWSKKKNLRKCVIKSKTVLFYRATSIRIEIILFVDSRQNLKKFKF